MHTEQEREVTGV